jgi:hypothetical protein
MSDQERIAELEEWGRKMCESVSEAYLASNPSDMKRGEVFYKVYAEARRLGVFK